MRTWIIHLKAYIKKAFCVCSVTAFSLIELACFGPLLIDYYLGQAFWGLLPLFVQPIQQFEQTLFMIGTFIILLLLCVTYVIAKRTHDCSSLSQMDGSDEAYR